MLFYANKLIIKIKINISININFNFNNKCKNSSCSLSSFQFMPNKHISLSASQLRNKLSVRRVLAIGQSKK